MDEQDRLGQLLGRAAALDAEPVPDMAGLVRRGRRARRVRRAQRMGGVAVVALLVGVAVAAADSGDPERDVATVDSPTAPDERIWPDPATADVIDVTTTTTPTTPSTGDPGGGTGDEGGTTTSTTAPAGGPRRLLVSSATVAPYAPVGVRSEDPCPPGTRRVWVEVGAIGGTVAGTVVGGEEVATDAAGHWSVEVVIIAVGGIQNVDFARTADQLEVRGFCGGDHGGAPDYEPVRVRAGRVTVVPELTATWDGQTATIRLSGCPAASLAHLVTGDEPPPPGPSFTGVVAIGPLTPGPEPDTWIATVDLPGYDPSDGLWASAMCNETYSNVTGIWRYKAFELDPPG